MSERCPMESDADSTCGLDTSGCDGGCSDGRYVYFAGDSCGLTDAGGRLFKPWPIDPLALRVRFPQPATHILRVTPKSPAARTLGVTIDNGVNLSYT